MTILITTINRGHISLVNIVPNLLVERAFNLICIRFSLQVAVPPISQVYSCHKNLAKSLVSLEVAGNRWPVIVIMRVIFYLMLFFLNSSFLHLARALLLLFNRRGPKRKVERNETEPCKIRRRRSPHIISQVIDIKAVLDP